LGARVVELSGFEKMMSLDILNVGRIVMNRKILFSLLGPESWK
jgi:hypothetical protein